MDYSKFYPVGYQNYGALQQQQTTNSQNLIWVQGEAAAKSYLVAPNSSVVLWDSEDQVIYVKSADASGMPSMKILDYTIRESAAPESHIQAVEGFATKEDISLIKEEIEALREDLKPKKTKVSER